MDLKKRESHIDSIVQVWFSTTWSEATEAAVKEGLSSLLSSTGKRFESSVLYIIEHWRRASRMSLEEARSRVQESISTSKGSIGALKKRNDRVSMASYLLTGDFCVRDPVCGSTVMFDCPDGTPPPSLGENIFQALPFQDVMSIAMENPQETVLDAAERCVLSGITHLVSLCASNRVRVELRCNRVQDVIDEIASERPWTMSWSNILDYADYGDFHKMARKCSKHGDTIHFGYSMNWPTEVWGTCLIDYAFSDFVELRKEMIKKSNRAVETAYQDLGWDSYLRIPIPQNPINTVARGLELAYHKKWSDHFFSVAHREGILCKVGRVEYGTHSPLSYSGNSTVHLAWSYDVDNRFVYQKTV